MENENKIKSHKHYTIAYHAHYNTSFVPDKRAEQYCEGFDQSIEKLESLGVPKDKIAKYESLWCDWMRKKGNCLSSMITGPANFPVRRAEKANNAERNASDACDEYYRKLVAFAEREAYYEKHPEARPVKSSDDDAIERLTAKLEKLEAKQAEMKAHNVKCRKEKQGQCFQPFELTNNNSKIKSTKERIASIESRKDAGERQIEINGVKVVQNPNDMRLQLFFDGKPTSDIIKLLKTKAFKWSPSNQCWQRQLTNNAIYSFKAFIRPALEKM